MKRLILSVAILAVAASCSQNEVVDVVSSKNLIGFSTLNSVATKSATENKDSYQVYAHLTTSPSSDAWYIDTQVTDANSAAGTYYWPDSNGTLDFFAYAPTTTNTNIVESAETIGTSVKVTATADGETDFTIATSKTGLNYTENYESNVVAFQFAHQFAKVNISLVLDADLISGGYSIVDNNSDSNNIAFTVNESLLAYTLSKGAPVSETVTTTAATYADALDASVNYIVPQAAKDCKIDISDIKILKDGSIEHFAGDISTYTMAETDITNSIGFVAGKLYNITLTISKDSSGIFDSSNMISFSATVADWTTETSNDAVDVEEEDVAGTPDIV